MDALQAIADRHGLLIIEDAAQGLGSQFKGRQAGTFGIASAISFYPAKTLGCLGDGGAVLTNDDDPDHFDVYQNYEIEAEQRDELRAFLKEKGIGTIIQWGGKAVHQFEKLGFKVSLPFVEKMFTRCLMLPMNRSLTGEDVTYVCQRVREFYGY